tara:strand:- start:4235 stop:5674 length:1440 start_codon:yes stop_codon:yes gene_type:complete
MYNQKIIPVILCGGTGSRLWPLSRESFPKQYLEIKPENSLSFFQETINRIKHIKNIDNPIVICSEEHRFIVSEQIREVGVKAKSILLEPFGRNTAPAITVAALKAIQEDIDPALLIMPADHIIKDINVFKNVINQALKDVYNGKLVTFGITPSRAETGYGYIQSTKELNYKKLKGEKIVRFIEKPNKEVASKFLADGRFTWNSGIFLFNAQSVLKEIDYFCPEIFNLCKKSLLNKEFDLGFQRLDKKSFNLCKSISFDKAIMEKTNLGIVFPLNAGWNDIGSWESMWDISEKDESGNVSLGNIFAENVRNSYLRSEERLIVGMDIENLIIVECKDAILVANKEKTQDVKAIVKSLKNKGASEATTHKNIFRPWGNYSSLAEGDNWQVKKIIVKPGESLSLQLHNQRTEHWIVVSGTARVEIDGFEKIIKENESVYIPLAAKHRLSNPGNEKLILIEVQSGEYLGEDDIVRFDDNYGRAN